MSNLIRLELMKWKRSKILLASLLTPAIGPFVATLSTYQKLKGDAGTATWKAFFGVALQVNLSLIFPIVFGALAAYVFVQEYQDRTIINLFTLPQSRVKILFAKLSTIFLTLLSIILMSIFFSFILGNFIVPEKLTQNIVLSMSSLSLVTGVMATLFVPFFAYIGIRTKHYIPPLIGATMFTFLNFASLVSETYGPLVPTAIPVFYLLKSIGWFFGHIPFVWSMLFPIFIFSLVFTALEYIKQEIH